MHTQMFGQSLRDILFFGVLFVFFCIIFVDEDPIFDLTDLNQFHVLAFIGSLLSVLIDNLVKRKAGSFADGDSQVTLYAIFDFNAMLWYFFAIWVGFYVHTLPPMFGDVVEERVVWTAFFELTCVHMITPLLAVALVVAVQGMQTTGLSKILSSSSLLIAATKVSVLFWDCLWSFLGRVTVSFESRLVPESGSQVSATSYVNYQPQTFDWFDNQAHSVLPFLSDSASLYILAFNLVFLTAVLLTLLVSIIGEFSSTSGVSGFVSMRRQLVVLTMSLSFPFIWWSLLVTLCYISSHSRALLASSDLSWL